MTWSFDDSLATDADYVRLKIGDTNTKDQLLSDETIAAVLVAKPTVLLASIECVRAIIAKLARDTDRSNLGMSTSRSQQITHYEDLLGRLIDESKGLDTESYNVAQGYFGGTSTSAKDALEADSDYESPPIGRYDNDNNSSTE